MVRLFFLSDVCSCWPDGVRSVHCIPAFVGDIERFFVKLFVDTNPGGYTICLDVNESDTIASVKAKIQNKEGIPPKKIRLVYKGERLCSQKTLASYGIVDDDVSDYTVFGMVLPETLPMPPMSP